MKRRLVIFLKVPKPGRVKTRLAKGIGAIRATWWYRHQVRRTLRVLGDPRWILVLAVSPDVEGQGAKAWPAKIERIAQGGGNLGVRMERVFRTFAPEPTIIVGSDVPGITRAAIADGFKKLGNADAVVGPSPDGGYWLIGRRGTRARSKDQFRNVRWSTEYALQDTLAAMVRSRVARATSLNDVDELSDLRNQKPR